MPPPSLGQRAKLAQQTTDGLELDDPGNRREGRSNAANEREKDSGAVAFCDFTRVPAIISPDRLVPT